LAAAERRADGALLERGELLGLCLRARGAGQCFLTRKDAAGSTPADLLLMSTSAAGVLGAGGAGLLGSSARGRGAALWASAAAALGRLLESEASPVDVARGLAALLRRSRFGPSASAEGGPQDGGGSVVCEAEVAPWDAGSAVARLPTQSTQPNGSLRVVGLGAAGAVPHDLVYLSHCVEGPGVTIQRDLDPAWACPCTVS
jgi:hypothetical protein